MSDRSPRRPMTNDIAEPDGKGLPLCCPMPTEGSWRTQRRGGDAVPVACRKEGASRLAVTGLREKESAAAGTRKDAGDTLGGRNRTGDTQAVRQPHSGDVAVPPEPGGQAFPGDGRTGSIRAGGPGDFPPASAELGTILALENVFHGRIGNTGRAGGALRRHRVSPRLASGCVRPAGAGGLRAAVWPDLPPGMPLLLSGRGALRGRALLTPRRAPSAPRVGSRRQGAAR